MKPRQLALLDVAAASGLVKRGDELFVIADDELTLHRYDLGGRAQGRIALFDDLPLPDGHRARKALKPDLEALALLPDGSLLALGSGSRPSRDRGVWVQPGQWCRPVQLAPLYEALRERHARLNIEGAVVHGQALFLAHRDNRSGLDSAILRLDLDAVMAGVRAGVLEGTALRADVPLALDRGLAPTDLAVHDGAVWFSAAAEVTADPYEDGDINGSALGCLGADLTVAWVKPLEGAWKIEGLTSAPGGWLMVADADDRSALAPLLRLDAC